MFDTKNGQVPASFINKADGHGAQFEIHFEKGARLIPTEILSAIRSEIEGGNTLYVDGIRVKDGNLVMSLCRGSIVLAQVDNRWNNQRKDEKYHVIKREEIESDVEKNLPKFLID